ncbi:MAG: hypothetical protein IKC94_05565, partial [Lentisphaeria bacterium]|nr:hypothetical protein [Lentisphaeria bacterium]
VLNASRITFYNTNAKTTFTLTGSDVEIGQFMTRDQDSVFTLDNTKLYSTSTINGNDEGQYNAGTLNVLNGSTLTYTSAMTNEATGKIVISADSMLIAPEIIMVDGASITIDGTGFTSGTNKVIDLNGTESLQDKITIENLEEGITVAYGKDGDVLITDASLQKLYVDSAYADKDFGAIDGDKVFGINAFGSLLEALDAKTADTEEIVIESDITEALSGKTISGKLTAGSAVTIADSANDNYVNFTGTTLDKNITVDAKYFYLYGENTFNGNVKSSSTFYSSGKLTLTGNAEVYTTMSRYYVNADDGIYVVGTAAAGEGKNAAVQYKSINYLGHYSGTFSVKDTAAEFGYILLNGDTDGDGYSKATLVADNALIKTIGGPNTQPGQVLMNGDSSIVATNGSVLDFRGPKDFGYLSMQENNSISLTDSEMYLGKEGQGSNTLDGTITLTNSTLSSLGTITNNGTIKITGESTLNVGKVTGNALQVEDAEITNSVVGVAKYDAENNIIGVTGETATAKLYGNVELSGSNFFDTIHAGRDTSYDKATVVTITGDFWAYNFLTGTVHADNKVYIGDGETATDAYFGNLGGFGAIDINSANVDYGYAYIRNVTNIKNSTLTNKSINTYFSGNAVTVVDNSTWSAGSFVTIGSYGGDFMAGNADVTLQNGAVMNVGNLEIYEAADKTVKLTVNDSTVNSTGALTISTGAEVYLNEGALLNASGTLTNNGQIIVDVTDTWQGVAKIIDVAEGETVDKTNIKLNEADAANGVQIEVGDDGDLLVYKVPVDKVYVDSNFVGDFGAKVAEGKFMNINAFNTLSGYDASESTKALEIAGGTYKEGAGTWIDLAKGGINSVTTDGVVIAEKGNLLFDKSEAGEYTISGSYQTLGTEGFLWENGQNLGWKTNGVIRFKGADGVVYNLSNANITSSAAVQFIGGKTIISADSTISGDSATESKMAVYGEVVNYGKIDLVTTGNPGTALLIGHGSYASNANKFTVSGENASVNIDTGAATDAEIHSSGTLVVENKAAFTAENVNNAGAITIDNAAFTAAVLTNSNVITIKGAAELAIGKLVNTDATLNIENFTNEFNLDVDGGTIKVTGELKLGADADITDAVLDGGKLVITGADQTVKLAENSTVTLVVDKTAILTAGNDFIGNVDITGENAELTADDELFKGNKVSGVKLVITNADNVINVDAALADIAEINGSKVENFNGVYYFVTNDDNGTPDDSTDDKQVTNILAKDENGISYAAQGSGDGDGSVDGEKEFGNITVKGDGSVNPDLDITMKKGTTTIKVANGKADDKTVFEIGSIGKNADGGKTNLNFGNYSDVAINGDVDAMGNLTVGKNSELDVAGKLNGKNINQSIKIGADSTADFADIDLMGGKNSFSVAAGATVTAGEVAGISSLSLASGKANDIATMTVDNYIAAAVNNSITLGNYAELMVYGEIDNGGVASGTGTTVKTGSYAKLTVDNGINGLAAMTLGKGASFIGSALEGTEKSNKINLGAEATLTTGVIDLKDGKNSITLGKGADLTATTISNVQTINGGAEADLTVGAINGVQKVTVGKGGWLNAETVNGTEGNDTFNFGNESLIGSENQAITLDFADGNDTLKLGNKAKAYFADVTFGEGKNTLNIGNDTVADFAEVTFGAGNDTVKIGSNSIVNFGELNMGEADNDKDKDTLTIGKDAKVYVNAITGVETLNAAKGAKIWFTNGADTDVNLTGVKGSWKNAEILDDRGSVTGASGEELTFGGEVYANECDVYFIGGKVADLKSGTAEVWYSTDNGDSWLLYPWAPGFDGEIDYIKVGVDFTDKDQYAKKEYSFNIKLA